MNDKNITDLSLNQHIEVNDDTVNLYNKFLELTHKFNKLDETKNISWNNIIEKNVLEIGEKSKGYKIMHTQQSEIINNRYEILMYSGIILGPLSGLLSSIGVIINQPNVSILLPIISTCVGFVSGIVVAITKYGKYEKKSSDHKLAASKYTSLESNVRRQCALRRSDRVNAVQYLEWIGNSFDELFLTSPLIDKKIYEKYVELAKEHGLVIADEYKITINVDDNFCSEQKNRESKDTSHININYNVEGNAEKSALFVENGQKKFTNVKRGDSIEIIDIGLNKFSDTRMEYEFNRMINLQ